MTYRLVVGAALVLVMLLALTSACEGSGDALPNSGLDTATRTATPSPAATATRTRSPWPTSTPSPTPTPVPTATLAERLGVPVRELRLLPPEPLPAGWKLLARQGPCYQCGFGLGEPRLWKGGWELEYISLLAHLGPGEGYAYGFAFDAAAGRMAVAWCRTGYCGGESDPSDDAGAELYPSEDGGETWSRLGDLDVPSYVRGFVAGRLLISHYEIKEKWKVSYRFWQGEPFLPPAGMDPDWVVLPSGGRSAVWLQYGPGGRLPGQWQDSEGPVLPPLEGEFRLIALSGKEVFLWEAREPPVAEDERQPESLLVAADRNGTARTAWAWYGGWWSLRGLTADRYVVGHMDDPGTAVGGPVPVVVDLEEGTVLPIAGLPRSREDSFTYPDVLFVPVPWRPNGRPRICGLPELRFQSAKAWVPSASPQTCRAHIRVPKVAADEEEGLSDRLRQGIGEAIAEVELGRVAAPLAEVAVCVPANARLLGGDRLDTDPRDSDQFVEASARDGIPARVDDDRCLEEGPRGDASHVRLLDCCCHGGRFGLCPQDRQDRRGVDDHRGSPRSS